MRLTEAERDAILACARHVFGQGSTVRLFGSRTDDTRRGGDIDLHVVAERPEAATVEDEVLFVPALHGTIGELRTDIVAPSPGFAPRPIGEIALASDMVMA